MAQLAAAGASGMFGDLASDGSMLLGGVAAKLSIAKETPAEQRTKAANARGLKTPDSEEEFFCMGFSFAELRDELRRQHRHGRVPCRSDITGIDAPAGVDIEPESLLVRNRHGVVSHRRDIARVSAASGVHIA